MVYSLQKSYGTKLLQLMQMHDFLNTYNYINIAALCLRYYINNYALYIIIRIVSIGTCMGLSKPKCRHVQLQRIL